MNVHVINIIRTILGVHYYYDVPGVVFDVVHHMCTVYCVTYYLYSEYSLIRRNSFSKNMVD